MVFELWTASEVGLSVYISCSVIVAKGTAKSALAPSP